MGVDALRTANYLGKVESGADGVHTFAYDTDIDQAISLITTTATYAQLAAEGKLEVFSTGADSTQNVTIIGVTNDGKRAHETVAVVATAAVATSVKTWRYVENCYLDAECVGTISVRAVDNTLVNSIAIGDVSADVVQHFSGDDNDALIFGWWVGHKPSQTEEYYFELRFYPNDAKCLDSANDFRLLDYIIIKGDDNAPSTPTRITFPLPIRCPPGGWISVWGKAETNDNIIGYAGMQVVDVPIVGAL